MYNVFFSFTFLIVFLFVCVEHLFSHYLSFELLQVYPNGLIHLHNFHLTFNMAHPKWNKHHSICPREQKEDGAEKHAEEMCVRNMIIEQMLQYIRRSKCINKSTKQKSSRQKLKRCCFNWVNMHFSASFSFLLLNICISLQCMKLRNP